MKVATLGSNLHLLQSKYIRDLLLLSKMEGAKLCRTPIASKSNLSKYSDTPLPNGSEYRSIMGSLQYLSLTWPDIVYAVNKVCQFMHCPTTDHSVAVKRIIRYLKHTIQYGFLDNYLLLSPLMLSLMLIGQVVLMIVNLLLVVAYILGRISFLGA